MGLFSDIGKFFERIVTPPKEFLGIPVRKIFTPPEPVRKFLGIEDKKKASLVAFGATLGVATASMLAFTPVGGIVTQGIKGFTSAIFPTMTGISTPLTTTGMVGAKIGSALVTGVNIGASTLTTIGAFSELTQRTRRIPLEYDYQETAPPIVLQPVVLENTYFIPEMPISTNYSPYVVSSDGYKFSQGYGRVSGIQISNIGISPVFKLLSEPFVS